jgi:hypothetical protein
MFRLDVGQMIGAPGNSSARPNLSSLSNISGFSSYFVAQNYQVSAYSGARKQKNTAGDGRREVVKGRA